MSAVNTQEKTDRRAEAMARLEAGILAATETPEAWRRYLRCAARFHNYSFGNMLLIWFTKPDAERVAGFQTWKSLGRNVKQGEKAIWILAPMLLRVKDASSEDGDQDARKVFYKAVPVFDISQTEGEDLPSMPALPDGEDGGLFAALLTFASSRSIPVTVHEPSAGFSRAKGCCAWHKDASGFEFGDPEIHLAFNPSLLDKCAVLVHELAHALNDSPNGYREHAADMELRAESVAYLVLQHFGFDAGELSFYYIRHWQDGANKDSAKSLKALGKSIQETAETIIEAVSKAMAAAAAEPGAFTQRIAA